MEAPGKKMKIYSVALAALLVSGGLASAQNPSEQPDLPDASNPTGTTGKRPLDQGNGNFAPPPVTGPATSSAPAPPKTTGQAQPKNSPDPNPLPGEEPRPIPR
jgi:hypothetical protein